MDYPALKELSYTNSFGKIIFKKSYSRKACVSTAEGAGRYQVWEPPCNRSILSSAFFTIALKDKLRFSTILNNLTTPTELGSC